MKNREIIMRRLEKIEGTMAKMHFALQRQGTREQFEDYLQASQELLSEVKAFIEQEPLGPGEINPY